MRWSANFLARPSYFLTWPPPSPPQVHPASNITYFFYFPKRHLSFHTFLPLRTVKSLPRLNVCFHNMISKFLSFLKASLHFPPPEAISSYSFVSNSFIEVSFAYHRFIHLKHTVSFSKSIHLRNHHHNPVLELNIITPKSSLTLDCGQFLLSPQTQATADLLSASIVWSFLEIAY